MPDALALTGERTVPGIASENYWFQRHVAAYRLAARLARGRILDAGSGEGYGTAILGGIGVELDSEAVRHASARYPDRSFVRGDLLTPPLREASVDAVVALQVVEHLDPAERFVDECARALRPGGVLIVSTPNRATFPGSLNPFHTHEYVAAELEEVLRSRFRRVRLVGVDHGNALRLLDRVLGEPVQRRLVSAPWHQQPRWLRTALGLVRAGLFRITTDPERSLDLVAICRDTIEG